MTRGEATHIHDYRRARLLKRRMNLSKARDHSSLIITDSSGSISNDLPGKDTSMGDDDLIESVYSDSFSRPSDSYRSEDEGRCPSPTTRHTSPTTNVRNMSDMKSSYAKPPIKVHPKKNFDKQPKKSRKPSLKAKERGRIDGDLIDFERMVKELDKASKKSNPTPVDRWKSVKLADSAHALAKRIDQTFDSLAGSESNLKSIDNFRTAKATLDRLSSDFAKDDNDKSRRQGLTNGKSDSCDSEQSESLTAEMCQMEISAEREDEYNQRIMREREAEVMEINKRMHKVGEIYKDLGAFVQSQQELIDDVEGHIDESKVNARSGLDQVEKANRPSMFARRGKSTGSEAKMERDFTWEQPFITIKEDLKDVSQDFMQLGSSILDSVKRAMLKCTQPDPTATDFIS